MWQGFENRIRAQRGNKIREGMVFFWSGVCDAGLGMEKEAVLPNSSQRWENECPACRAYRGILLLCHTPCSYKSAFRLKRRCVCSGAALWRSRRCSMSVINQAGDHSQSHGKWNEQLVSGWKKQRLIFQVFLPEEQTPFDDSSFLVFLFLILKLIYWIFKVYCRQWLPYTKIWLDIYA